MILFIGLKIQHFNKQYLFVADELKNLMVKASIEGIIFSRGFEHFGAL